MTTYEVRVYCKNCGFGHHSRKSIIILRGTPVQAAVCPYCGCKTLERAG